MSERRLVQCDNCETGLELPAPYDDLEDEEETEAWEHLVDQGWTVVSTNEEEAHLCSVRCLAVWSTARAVETGAIVVPTAAEVGSQEARTN